MRPSEEPPKLGTSHPLAAQARRARLDRALRDLFTPGLSARVLDRHLDMIEREHAFLEIGTARSALSNPTSASDETPQIKGS